DDPRRHGEPVVAPYQPLKQILKRTLTTVLTVQPEGRSAYATFSQLADYFIPGDLTSSERVTVQPSLLENTMTGFSTSGKLKPRLK
ncbi:hypothetical protein HWD97_23670, partial [Ochrobactrum sp. C6C9]|uniref:hypothetical protein n=1 Tax=Ochrobactrum sp. C6C9 TaxID=2736662 RepID=UPI00353027F8|nr:hypothetical protein [Ochrobactrum sp. C6C9]